MAIDSIYEGLPPDNVPYKENPEKRRYRFDPDVREKMKTEKGMSEAQIRIEEDIIANRIAENLAAKRAVEQLPEDDQQKAA